MNILLILSIIGFQSLTYKRQSTGEVYQYPTWTIVCGWSLASCCVVMIPLLAIWKILKAKGSFFEVSANKNPVC
ncbi:unnamed protein product [Schistocephalus solidus]|uniref:G_PROTEIN_RECEP_F2_4 domain-containing protein n=1 Tax=Schistocephalus solidus TaxID=70667 RepID=A0A183SFI5_SCHSO|nr:unnamed protein product [Schistocephalus solidus]